MAEAPSIPPFGGSQNAAPIQPPGQSLGLGPPPPPVPPTQAVSSAPPSASVTPTQKGSSLGLSAPGTPTRQWLAQPLPPASATPTRQAPGPPPQASLTPSREALRVEPPPQYAAPSAPRTTGTSQQPPPQEGTGTAATVAGVPPESPKKEYLSAVKAYEQQVGPNILRAKVYIESLPASAVPPEHTRTVAPGMTPGMAPGAECQYNVAMGAAPGQPCGYGRGMPMGGGYNDMAPGAECGYNVAMGVGPGQPCGYGRGMPMGGGYDAGRPMGGGYGQPMASERRSRGTTLAAQRSRERFREFAEMDTALKFAKLAEMGPQVKRLIDMAGSLEEIMNVPRNYEGPMVPSGSGYAGPPMRRRDSFERPMNAPGGFGGRPMPGYDVPMRLPPDYGGPPDRYDGPPPNARYYGRRAFFGDTSRSVREDYEHSREAASKQPPQKTASDLLRKVREDIEEHCADMLQQIHREIVDYEIEAEDERRVRGGGLPHSRTTSQRSFRDDGESRTARRFRDDCGVPRGSTSPWRQPSRRRQESSSSTSSSSDGKSRRSRTPRRCKDCSTKSLKSRSERRSKLETKSSSSSSNSSSLRGRRREKDKSAKRKSSSSSSSSFSDVPRGKKKAKSAKKKSSSSSSSSSSDVGRGKKKAKSAKKKSSSSSSSSSSDVGRGKKKGEGVEYTRSVTGRMPSEAEKALENIRKSCEVVVESLSSRRGGSGCPVLNMLGIPSRNVAEALPAYGVEERRRSRNFGGEIAVSNGVSRSASSNIGGEVEGYDNDVQRP